jgi:protein-arginine kinase
MSEDEILSKLKNIIEQIARQEVDIRYKIKNDKLTDKVYRSYGILKNSYLISYNEFMDLWSYVLMGNDMDIISVDRSEFIALISRCAPYNLLYESKQNLDSDGGRQAQRTPGQMDTRPQAPVQTIKNDAPKIGRNDPCPCGSGKKFKNCHGKGIV